MSKIGKLIVNQFFYLLFYMDDLINKRIYLDTTLETPESKLSFIKQIYKPFKIRLFIVENEDQKETINKLDIKTTITTGTNILQKHFSIQSLFGGEIKHINKLIVIYKFTSEIANNRLMDLIMRHNKEFNITIIILSCDDHLFKSALKLVDTLVFDKKTNIQETYNKYFSVYPQMDIFESKLNELTNDKYLLYNKNTTRHVTCDERFVILDIVNSDANISKSIDMDDIIIHIEI